MNIKNEQVIEIAKKASPAVVSIVVSKNMPKIEGFYEMPYQGKKVMVPKMKKGEKQSVKIGGGSGFLVSSDGVILTNSHVLHDPHAQYTVLMDHEEEAKHKVEVIARDPIHDIAICKIDAKGKELPHLELGDSTDLQLGEFVMAVGNALGEFSNTVSLGIVSGLSRFIQAQQGGNEGRHAERLRGLIQTDAAINPGNSGGPLINMEGKVIGINTAVVFGAQNIGFSIPVNQAKKDIEDVREYGRVRFPFLGVRYLILDEELQKKNNLPVDYGALITRETLGDTAVVPGSSAAKAGLKEFDIILEIEGKKITPQTTVQDVLQEYEIGNTVSVKILRNKKEQGVEVKLEEKMH